jgi:alkylation response protein AidB-like acyl-CoA dehydrogenase
MAVATAYTDKTDEQKAIGEGTSEIQRMVIGKKLLERHKV